jgi:hypothetical protein
MILLDNSGIYKNRLAFYNALAGWVKKFKENFGEEIIRKSGLDILLTLDAQKYITKNPDIPLEEYERRVSKYLPCTADILKRYVETGRVEGKGYYTKD